MPFSSYGGGEVWGGGWTDKAGDPNLSGKRSCNIMVCWQIALVLLREADAKEKTV